MSEFICELPWPPSVNTYYTVWRGRKILSKKAKEFKVACLSCVEPPNEPLQGALRVSVYLGMPDKRKRDIDNLLKPILDALTDCSVYGDDSQIVSLLIEKKYANIKGGLVRVCVESYITES